jgi:AcrR family transcriptional regulator
VSRGRGRPPKSDDLATRERLLDAAAAACADVGFDAVTVAEVAKRVGVTPAAVYNHFADKGELLYTAGRLAIDRLATSTVPADGPAGSAREVAAAFLDPGFRTSRRLVLELHLAGARHPELAAHLADWHREFAVPPADPGRSEDDRAATVKAYFLLLLGLCHVEDLAAIDASPTALQAQVDRLVDVLFPA